MQFHNLLQLPVH